MAANKWNRLRRKAAKRARLLADVLDPAFDAYWASIARGETDADACRAITRTLASKLFVQAIGDSLAQLFERMARDAQKVGK